MKPKTQVHRNGGKKVGNSQARTKPEPRNGKTPSQSEGGDEPPVTLAFYTQDPEEKIGTMDITAEKFRAVQAAAKRARQPVGEFVANGIYEIVRQLETNAADMVTLRLTRPDDSARKLASPAKDKVTAEITLSEEINNYAVKRAQSDGLSFSGWVRHLIEQHRLMHGHASNRPGAGEIERDGEPGLRCSPAEELQAAINQAHALNELLEYRVCHLDDGGDYSEAIQCGLIELSGETFNRLRRASAGVTGS